MPNQIVARFDLGLAIDQLTHSFRFGDLAIPGPTGGLLGSFLSSLTVRVGTVIPENTSTSAVNPMPVSLHQDDVEDNPAKA